jgi:hypothetical protein
VTSSTALPVASITSHVTIACPRIQFLAGPPLVEQV